LVRPVSVEKTKTDKKVEVDSFSIWVRTRAEGGIDVVLGLPWLTSVFVIELLGERGKSSQRVAHPATGSSVPKLS
jgi:hypothetical protein